MAALADIQTRSLLMHAIVSLRLRARRLLWPEAPHPAPAVRREPVPPHELAQAFHQVMAGGITCAPYARLDESILAAELSSALQQVLTDYRTAQAQTPAEREIGRALDYVACQYLRA